MLKNMNKMYTGKDFSKGPSTMDKLTPDKIEDAAGTTLYFCSDSFEALLVVHACMHTYIHTYIHILIQTNTHTHTHTHTQRK